MTENKCLENICEILTSNKYLTNVDIICYWLIDLKNEEKKIKKIEDELKIIKVLNNSSKKIIKNGIYLYSF